jgi:hypothetical protein
MILPVAEPIYNEEKDPADDTLVAERFGKGADWFSSSRNFALPTASPYLTPRRWRSHIMVGVDGATPLEGRRPLLGASVEAYPAPRRSRAFRPRWEAGILDLPKS